MRGQTAAVVFFVLLQTNTSTRRHDAFSADRPEVIAKAGGHQADADTAVRLRGTICLVELS